MYEKKYHLVVTDVDSYLDLRMSSFFQMMQDVAVEHAEILGIGKSETIDKGLFWVITRIALTVYKMPKYLDTVILRTYPGNDMKFIFPRYFQLVSESGEVLITASSSWCVLNKADHRINLNPFNGKVLPTEHLDIEEPLPRKVTYNDELNEVERRSVRFSDIDLNSHLNNTRYIEYIFDTHSKEFYDKYQIHKLTINYEHELKAGDTVELLSNNQNPEYIKGKIDNQTIFDVQLEFNNRK